MTSVLSESQDEAILPSVGCRVLLPPKVVLVRDNLVYVSKRNELGDFDKSWIAVGEQKTNNQTNKKPCDNNNRKVYLHAIQHKMIKSKLISCRSL